jgi:hypothetical protein
LELHIARAGAAALAVLLVVLWLRGSSLRDSAFFRRLISRESPIDPAASRRFFNGSLGVMMVALVIGVFYATKGQFLLSDEARIAINREDGWIEYPTAIIFLLCAIVSATIPFRSRLKGRKLVDGLLALGFLACAAEEISWGQRIFDFGTPDALKGLNVQNEFNLHNLMGYAADHVFIAGVFFFGAALPLFSLRHEDVGRALVLLGVPIASLGLAVGFILTSGVHEWTLGRFAPQGDLRVAELRELLSALGILLLMIEVFRSEPRGAAGDAT